MLAVIGHDLRGASALCMTTLSRSEVSPLFCVAVPNRCQRWRDSHSPSICTGSSLQAQPVYGHKIRGLSALRSLPPLLKSQKGTEHRARINTKREVSRIDLAWSSNHITQRSKPLPACGSLSAPIPVQMRLGHQLLHNEAPSMYFHLAFSRWFYAPTLACT
jgi:hypothetical protein